MCETTYDVQSSSAHAVSVYDTMDERLEARELDDLFSQISVKAPLKPRERSYEQIQTLYQSNRLIARAMEQENHL